MVDKSYSLIQLSLLYYKQKKFLIGNGKNKKLNLSLGVYLVIRAESTHQNIIVE